MDIRKSNHCLNCNKTIEKGRTDKKFCDYYCRNSYNNRQANESEKIIKTINQILRKNRMILKMINPEGRSLVKKEFLQLQGFNFKYFTHKYDNKNGGIFWFCYEYGYTSTVNEPENIIIVNWKNYIVDQNNSIPANNTLL